MAYITGEDMVNLIIECLSKDQQTLLAITNEEKELVSARERFLGAYKNKFGRCDGIEAKTGIAEIITKNACNFNKLKEFKYLQTRVLNLDSYADVIQTTDNRSTDRNSISRTSTFARALGANQGKSRGGTAEYDEEFNKEKDGDAEDQKQFDYLLQENPQADLAVIDVHDPATKKTRKQVVNVDLPKPVDKTPLDLATVNKDPESIVYFQGVQIGSTRQISLTNTSSNAVADAHSYGQDSRQKIIKRYNRADALERMQKFKWEDMAVRIITSFSILFIDELICL